MKSLNTILEELYETSPAWLHRYNFIHFWDFSELSIFFNCWFLFLLPLKELSLCYLSYYPSLESEFHEYKITSFYSGLPLVIPTTQEAFKIACSMNEYSANISQDYLSFHFIMLILLYKMLNYVF